MKRCVLLLGTVLLLSGGNPAMAGGWNHFISWSSDGMMIAYVMDGLPFVISPDGTSRQILPHAGSIAMTKISPDHSMVAMWGPKGYSLGMRGGAGPGTGEIQIATSDGKKWKSIGGGGNNFSWSPDGKYLVIDGVLVADVKRLWEDGYEPKELGPPARGGWSVSWSPSGKKLAQCVSEVPGNSYLLQMTEVASGNTKNIPFNAFTVTWVDWLDEETLLVVASARRTGEGEYLPDHKLWKIDINSGVFSQLGGPVPYSRDGPHLSLDKKRFIACAGNTRSTKTGIWIGDVGEQMSLKKLPVGGFDGSVNLTCWSPAGDKCVFMTGHTMYGPEQTLWLYDINDGKQTKLDAGVGGKDMSGRVLGLYNSED